MNKHSLSKKRRRDRRQPAQKHRTSGAPRPLSKAAGFSPFWLIFFVRSGRRFDLSICFRRRRREPIQTRTDRSKFEVERRVSRCRRKNSSGAAWNSPHPRLGRTPRARKAAIESPFARSAVFKSARSASAFASFPTTAAIARSSARPPTAAFSQPKARRLNWKGRVTRAAF